LLFLIVFSIFQAFTIILFYFSHKKAQLLHPIAAIVVLNGGLSFADLVLQGPQREPTPRYMDTSFISCTSVVVESLFLKNKQYFVVSRFGKKPEKF
jgi:hypothetical protein